MYTDKFDRHLFPCNYPTSTQMSDFERRKLSFRNSPKHLQNSLDTFADAGFYYSGEGDCLKCFYCDGDLRNWTEGEDPWFEHAKWYPNCEYLLMKKGLQFVDKISSRYPYLKKAMSQYRDDDTLGSFKLNPGLSSSLIIKRPNNMPVQETNVKDYTWLQTAVESIDISPTYKAANIQHRENSNADVRPAFLQSDCKSTSRPLSSTKTLTKGNKLIKMHPQKNNCSSGNKNLNSSEDLKRIEEIIYQHTCKICLDRKSSCVFLPCKHLSCCIECASALLKCPICREKIDKIIKVYRY